jgi:hypothetical protein
MRKLILSVATLALLSTAAFAEKSDDDKKMAAMRHQFMVMTQQMIDGQMQMMKINETMLTNYQQLLKQMMTAEEGGDQ